MFLDVVNVNIRVHTARDSVRKLLVRTEFNTLNRIFMLAYYSSNFTCAIVAQTDPPAQVSGDDDWLTGVESKTVDASLVPLDFLIRWLYLFETQVLVILWRPYP